MNTRIIVVCVILLLVIGMVVVGQSYLRQQSIIDSATNSTLDTSDKPGDEIALPISKKSVVVSIDFGSTKQSGRSTAKNVYDALIEVAKSNNDIVETKQYRYGISIVKIGSLANSGSTSWQFTVNGKKQEISPDHTNVNPGDTIEWRYTK